MRKACAAAGLLPFQLVTQPLGLERSDPQALEAGEVALGGLGHLVAGAEMHVAVLEVRRRARELGVAAQRQQLVLGQDLVDAHRPLPLHAYPCGVTTRRARPRSSPSWRSRQMMNSPATVTSAAPISIGPVGTSPNSP